MEIVFSLITGFANGFFSSGAGQILLFYLVFIKKEDTKYARNITLFIMPLISIISLIIYIKRSSIKILTGVILSIISIVFGMMGNNLMNKFEKNNLNLLSGIILVVITTINVWRLL